MVASKHRIERHIPLIVTLFGVNTPESSKICQKVEAFFLLNAPKYLGARLFYSLFVKTLHIF